MKSRNKYGNRRCSMDGYTFDSVKEMNRYADLKFMLLAHEITDLEIQKEYELQQEKDDGIQGINDNRGIRHGNQNNNRRIWCKGVEIR